VKADTGQKGREDTVVQIRGALAISRWSERICRTIDGRLERQGSDNGDGAAEMKSGHNMMVLGIGKRQERVYGNQYNRAPAWRKRSQAFAKKKDAEAELGKRVSLKAEGRYLDIKKECTTIFGELVKKYEENFKHQTSFDNWKKLCLSNFKEYFGADTIISNVRYVDLETYRNHLRQKLTHKRTIRTDATVNREISCLHHLFSKGAEWELLEQNPFGRGKSLLMKENNQRLRFLSQEELKKLLAVSPDHLQEIIICAVNTGMRRGEMLSLKWEQIHNGFIYLQKTKTNEPRQIPINDTLVELFKMIKKQNPGSAYVFAYRTSKKDKTKASENLKVVKFNNTPMNNIKHSFVTAVKKSKIEHCRMHDMRHTFASHLLMNGASLKDVQELLGHKTIEMTLRYAHLSQAHKKNAVNLLNGLTDPLNATCHKMSQNQENQVEKGLANVG
jgi:integrase